MKKNHIDIPKPSSVFHKVSCGECGETQVIYSHATSKIACNSCGNTITKPTGSKAVINGTISESVK